MEFIVFIFLLAVIFILSPKPAKTRRKFKNQIKAKKPTTSVTPVPTYKPYIYITPEGKRDYLSSDKWKVTKRAILFRDQYTCQVCKDTGIPLEVHHITYEDFGQEKPEQLVSLCRTCHGELHNRLGYDHNNTFPIN